MADMAKCEHCARFWKDLEQQAEQSRAWLDKLLAESERDLTALLAKLESDTSLDDMLAQLDAGASIEALLASLDCPKMSQNVRPGAHSNLQNGAKMRSESALFEQKERENSAF